MQAFDSVNRSTIPDCLKQFSVSNKLINLVKLTLQGTKLKVKINNDYTEQFEVRTGVKQGDPLSPILFSIVLDVIIRKLEIRGNISTGLKQLSAYADEVLIMGRTKQTLIDTFLKLKNEALKYGLIIKNPRCKTECGISAV
jgi:retron-type reverse transcriptase